jgi:hypothetical protein
MTALETIALQRAAHRKHVRRQILGDYLAAAIRSIILVLLFSWFYTSRIEISRMFYRACYAFVTGAYTTGSSNQYR